MNSANRLAIYPAIDLLDGRVVRLHKGRYDAVTVYSDDPQAVLAEFARDGATRVHLVDLSGARDGMPTQAGLIRTLLRTSGGAVSVQVGGGIRTLPQVEAYLEAGADRIVLGTAAIRDPAFVADVCSRFPVVVAVDALDGMVSTEGWTSGSTLSAMELSQRARTMGAVAVLYTDISRDGTRAGPNVEHTAALARAVPELEVIASGGVGSLADLAALREAGGIRACIVGRALYDNVFTLEEAIARAGSAPKSP